MEMKQRIALAEPIQAYGRRRLLFPVVSAAGCNTVALCDFVAFAAISRSYKLACWKDCSIASEVNHFLQEPNFAGLQ